MTRDDVLARTRRARYTAGRLANIDGTPGREVPDYAAEDGVDPARGTETFAEITLELDSQRWAGTPFVLRGGKALAARRKAVGIYFKPASQMLFAADAADRVANQLWIGIDGPEDITLHLTGGPTRPPGAPAPLILTGRPPGTDIPAYGRVLLDLLGGGASLSVRGDEAEEAWRIVMPVLDGWAEGAVPLEEYEAGSSGPAPGPRHD